VIEVGTDRERLIFLLETAEAERRHLLVSDSRVFAGAMSASRLATLETDIELAERIDAFVARFGRLQVTLGDKLLPVLLRLVAEAVGTALDNLDKAERSTAEGERSRSTRRSSTAATSRQYPGPPRHRGAGRG